MEKEKEEEQRSTFYRTNLIAANSLPKRNTSRFMHCFFFIDLWTVVEKQQIVKCSNTEQHISCNVNHWIWTYREKENKRKKLFIIIITNQSNQSLTFVRPEQKRCENTATTTTKMIKMIHLNNRKKKQEMWTLSNNNNNYRMWIRRWEFQAKKRHSNPKKSLGLLWVWFFFVLDYERKNFKHIHDYIKYSAIFVAFHLILSAVRLICTFTLGFFVLTLDFVSDRMPKLRRFGWKRTTTHNNRIYSSHFCVILFVLLVCLSFFASIRITRLNH